MTEKDLNDIFYKIHINNFAYKIIHKKYDDIMLRSSIIHFLKVYNLDINNYQIIHDNLKNYSVLKENNDKLIKKVLRIIKIKKLK